MAERLDQAFNSLDAQREAGIDYIKSQKHEGWKVVSIRYDDGGFSGGTMKRPGLTRLTLEDLRTAARQLDWERQATELGIKSGMNHRRAANPAA